MKQNIIVTEDFIKRVHSENTRFSNYKFEYFYSLVKDLLNKEISFYKTSSILEKNNGIKKLFVEKLPKIDSSRSSGIAFFRERGWTEEEIYQKTKLNIKKKNTLSPFNYKTYMIKYGMNEEQARYEANKRRHIRKEYWLERGYNEEEAIKLAAEAKHKNNIKGASAARDKFPKEFFLDTNLKYYTIRGLTEEEAKNALKERQTTFSLEKCIERYGEIKGKEVWQERQDRWQDTLNSKSEEEKNRINKSKNAYSYILYKQRHKDIIDINTLNENFRQFIFNSTGTIIPDTLEELKEFVILNSNIENNICFYSNKLLAKKFPKYLLEFFEFKTYDEFSDWLLTFIEFKDGEVIKQTIGYYNKWVENKLLRSSNEIHFHILLEQKGLKYLVDYEIEKYYPNSSLRSDFYLKKSNQYIEIAGFNTEEYNQHMKYKQDTFGSIILRSKKDYSLFIDSFYNQYYANNN